MKSDDRPTVSIVEDGPYEVSGGLPLGEATIDANASGESVAWRAGRSYPARQRYALCRCGRSASKPFCDGSHARTGFDGSETADRTPYVEQARLMRGPQLSLSDAESLCAFARFCDRHGKVWRLVGQTDGEATRRIFLQQTSDCPSGRLVAWDNGTGEPIEPRFEPSIALVEDPAQQCSGPIWLRGGIGVIGADGFEYEVRNRATLCRCGASSNKPFCDGSHAEVGFDSGARGAGG